MDRSVATLLEPNAQCYSACAIIFMAGGYTFEGNFISYRSMYKSARLGFHAPYIKSSGSQQLDAAVVYSAAIRAIRDLANLGKNHRAQEDVMPTVLFAELLSKGPDEVFLIDTVFKAVHSRIRVLGISTPSVTVQMLGNACVNKFGVAGSPDSRFAAGRLRTRPAAARRGALFWFDDFGGEGTAFCVVKYPPDSVSSSFGVLFSLYSDLVTSTRQSVDEGNFIGPGTLYLYPPSILLQNIP